MKRILSHVHWVWLPAVLFYLVVDWQRYGPVVVALAAAGGLALAFYAERRARVRRARQARQSELLHPPAGSPDAADDVDTR